MRKQQLVCDFPENQEAVGRHPAESLSRPRSYTRLAQVHKNKPQKIGLKSMRTVAVAAGRKVQRASEGSARYLHVSALINTRVPPRAAAGARRALVLAPSLAFNPATFWVKKLFLRIVLRQKPRGKLPKIYWRIKRRANF